MIRVDLKISPDDLKDSDIKAFLNVVDEDKSGALSVEELAEFAEHGISHFYNTETLDGKSLKLPRPKGCDPDALGRLLGAMQARLKGQQIRPRFKPVDQDGDGKASAGVGRNSSPRAEGAALRRLHTNAAPYRVPRYTPCPPFSRASPARPSRRPRRRTPPCSSTRSTAPVCR
mgnify:CR=1 FL=1